MQQDVTRLGIILGLIAFTSSNVSQAQNDYRIGAKLPATIAQQWLERSKQFQSAYWKIECKELFTPGTLNFSPEDLQEFGLLPPENELRTREIEIWIDRTIPRIRVEARGLLHQGSPLTLQPYEHTYLFDGQSLQKYTPKDANGFSEQSIALQEHDAHGPIAGKVIEGCMLPAFWALGIVFNGNLQVRSDSLNAVVKEENFRVHSIQREKNSLLVVLRAPVSRNGVIEYVVDPDKGGAVLQSSHLVNGKVVRDCEVEWEENESGWYPIAWRSNSYRSNDGALKIGGEFKVLGSELNPDLSEVVFHMTPKTGERYWDTESDTVYVKTSDGENVPQELFDIHSSAKRRRIYWILSIAAAFGIAVGIFWMNRRRLT